MAGHGKKQGYVSWDGFYPVVQSQKAVHLEFRYNLDTFRIVYLTLLNSRYK